MEKNVSPLSGYAELDSHPHTHNGKTNNVNMFVIPKQKGTKNRFKKQVKK